MVQWKTRLNCIIMDNSDIFEHQDIEQIILINDMLKNKVNDEKIKKYSIDLSGINRPLSPRKKPKSPILVQQNSQSVASLNKDDKSNSNFHYKLKILLFKFPNKVPLSSIVTNWKYADIVDDGNGNLRNDNDE